MQTVSAAFTAEEKDSVRSIVEGLLISWHRQNLLGNKTFTIGVSTIGGNHIIGINPGAIGSPGNYKYFDETSHITHLGWERGFNMPTGGLTVGMAEANLDNTSGRFTPRYMGGNSELFTAILPSRPMIINAGFKIKGVDTTLPEFAGIISEQPNVDMRDRSVSLKAFDYMSYFQNKYLDRSAIFTAQRTDQIMSTLLINQLGMSTAQFDLDYGINIIPFGIFDIGTKMSDIFGQLAEAENGHFYQDESGIFKFENRQHWDSAPFNQVQRVISTSMVLGAEAPSSDHLINVVEVKSTLRAKQPLRPIMDFNSSTPIAPNSTVDLFFNYDSPVLQVITPSATGSDSYYAANSATDDSGIDVTSSVTVKEISNFATTSKITFKNSSSSTVFLNHVVISGREAAEISSLYTRLQDDSSVTAYDIHSLSIENPLIQNSDWANSYAQMILNDFSNIENLQQITIRAVPELQLGDLISWQGRYWRVFDIKTTIDPAVGFIQELMLLQRNITTYFRIGISTIGSKDSIAP